MACLVTQGCAGSYDTGLFKVLFLCSLRNLKTPKQGAAGAAGGVLAVFSELETEDFTAMALVPFLFQPSQTAQELSGRNL